ncbi:hypothetical protein BTW01_00710 [Bacillus sp. SKDU12]|nr:hypothetical protein BTW01_00710 [Bacillus sp. SKDU12]
MPPLDAPTACQYFSPAEKRPFLSQAETAVSRFLFVQQESVIDIRFKSAADAFSSIRLCFDL